MQIHTYVHCHCYSIVDVIKPGHSVDNLSTAITNSQEDHCEKEIFELAFSSLCKDKLSKLHGNNTSKGLVGGFLDTRWPKRPTQCLPKRLQNTHTLRQNR